MWKDTIQLARVLQSRYGFDKDNLTLLTGDVTKAQIEKSFAELTRKVEHGDQVIIFLAGHNQLTLKIGSPNEKEPVFIPSQTPEALKRLTAREKIEDLDLIRPEESQAWIKSLSSKSAFVWVISDTCHGSSFSVVSEITRGADLVVFCGSRDNQYSWEVPEGGGVFTSSLCEVLREIQKPITYAELLQAVERKMWDKLQTIKERIDNPPVQTPWMSGNRDALVLGGRLPTPVPPRRVPPTVGVDESLSQRLQRYVLECAAQEPLSQRLWRYTFEGDDAFGARSVSEYLNPTCAVVSAITVVDELAQVQCQTDSSTKLKDLRRFGLHNNSLNHLENQWNHSRTGS